jgi:hypothetical protein
MNAAGPQRNTLLVPFLDSHDDDDELVAVVAMS